MLTRLTQLMDFSHVAPYHCHHYQQQQQRQHRATALCYYKHFPMHYLIWSSWQFSEVQEGVSLLAILDMKMLRL